MLTELQRNELNSGIGASECAAILGIDPYCTPYELWMIKMGNMEKQDISQKPHIIMGHLLEPIVAKRYSQLTGNSVARVNKAYRHKDFPHMLCHLDRKIVGQRKAVEIKTANPFSTNWGDAGTDEIPQNYIAQVQYQLACTGWDENDLIVFRGTTDLRIYPFKRDESIINIITDKVNYFWNHHILKNIPPEPTTRSDLKIMYPNNNGSYIDVTHNIKNHLEEYRDIKDKIKTLDSNKEKIEKEIIEFIAGNDGIMDNNDIIATFKANKNGIRSLRIKEGR